MPLLDGKERTAHDPDMKCKITEHCRVRARDLVDHSRFTYELSSFFGTVIIASVSVADAKLATHHGPSSSALMTMIRVVATTPEADYDRLVGMGLRRPIDR
jgi:hypothetical protein